MTDLDFIETTAKLIHGMILQQLKTMPTIWEEVWKKNRGPMQGYLKHFPKTNPEEDEEFEIEYVTEDPKYDLETEAKFRENLRTLTRLLFLNALYALGWMPEITETFTVDYLINFLHVNERYHQYIRFFLRSMAKEECLLLKMMDSEGNSFQFMDVPPSAEEVEERIVNIRNSIDVKRNEYRLIEDLGTNLSKILVGKLDPPNILQREDPRVVSSKMHYDGITAIVQKRSIEEKLIKHCKRLHRSYDKSTHTTSPTYRMLEVGAGTGTLSEVILEIISQETENFQLEYYYTDISPSFFDAAEKRLEKHVTSMSIIFKKYDMEKDPLEQGLVPGYFDIIVANEVLHLAKNIKETVKRLRSVLKSGGMMLATDWIHPDECETFVFGLHDEYWGFEDREFRKDHAVLTPEMWIEALGEGGFEDVAIAVEYNNLIGIITACASHTENMFLKNLSPSSRSWVIFHEDDDEFAKQLDVKITNVNRKSCMVSRPWTWKNFGEAEMEQYIKDALNAAQEGVETLEGIVYLWSISGDTRDQRDISLPFVSLLKLVANFKTPPKVFPLLIGACAIESYETINPNSGTVVGICRSLANENSMMNVTYLDLDPNKELIDQVDEVFMNLWAEHKQGAAFRDGLRLSPKLTAAKVKRNEPLSLPNGCDRFQLLLPKTRLISDLEFTYLEPYILQENEVEIHVKAMALNFRDIFAVIKPIKEFEKINNVGLDFTGIVVRVGEKVTKFQVGERVVGMITDDNISLPSHYKTSEERIIALPESLTFAEGSTLPAVFFTAVYCLVKIANLKEGETVLLHTASGGVGLVAIQLCKYIGANIIATAGSPRKRNYLRNLGIKHVFHSRTTDFKKDILEVTGGRGVDVVLNSITGPGFKEASLDVLCENGRFIEMSKLNVWTNEEVEALRPDVFYKIVDLTSLERDEYEKLTEELRQYMDKDCIKPIPYERFDALNIRGALNHMQKANHIGKIVCIMPEVKQERSRLTVTTPLFNNDSTYLVTGGLGGIGFEVVKWMLQNGAKHIAIASRSSPKPEIATQIETWNNMEKNVKAFQVDVGDFSQCKALFEELEKGEQGFPKIRGVMHVAGTLHDALLENQSWESFSHTYNPKVNGSWNLHELTKDYLLEHFVLFSSIAAAFGSPGQTNHSASNAFEDSFSAYRRCNGLPATCVNWGNWGEVGVATELDFPGLRPITTVQGLLALETFLKTQTNHVIVLNADSFPQALKLFPKLKDYLDNALLSGTVKQSIIINSDEFWKEVDSAPDRESKVECFKKYIKTTLKNVLKMDPTDTIDDHTEFQDLGIDSLMMLEMKNGLQNVLGGRMTLTANQVKDCKNTYMLANRLMDILEEEEDSVKNLMSPEEFQNLVREDSNLLSGKIAVENMEKEEIYQIKTVLLTGATGNLGPYLLREIVRREHVEKVYCLIRPTAKLSGEEKLRGRLEQMKLTEEVDLSKVEVVEGDLAMLMLGLTDEAYYKLCEEVDAVVHSAVKVDLRTIYWKAPENRKSHVRTVNVLGTARLLEFAAERKLKHFYHASSMLVFTGTGKDGQFSEGWQDVSVFDHFGYLGYVVSKHICEQLVYQAIEKGVPCKAFRFPHISGDSKTGRVDYQQNHAMLRWLASMKVGAIHDLPAPFSAVAVDHCAKISMDIFFHSDAPMDVYNVVQKSIEAEQIVVEVAQQFGIEIEITSYDNFMAKLKAEDEKSPISGFLSLFVEKDSDMLTYLENPSIQGLKKYLEDGSTCMDTSKLAKYVPEYESLGESACDALTRDFTYLKNEGVFQKHGIETSS